MNNTPVNNTPLNNNSNSFYEQLSKMIDEPIDDDIKECCISRQPLIEHAFTMDCGHTFNYIPLYTEICKQKFIYKTYTQYIGRNNRNYAIQCPYCRHFQQKILPYYSELNLALHYGVNTTNKDYYCPTLTARDSVCKYKGVTFSESTVCKEATTPDDPHYNPLCPQQVTPCVCLPGTTDVYCVYHYFDKLRIQKLQIKREIQQTKKLEKQAEKQAEKQEALQQKQAEKQEALQQKQEALQQKRNDKHLQKQHEIAQKAANKIKIFEDKNIERIAQGLKPLKMRVVYKCTTNEINTVKIV